MNDLIAVEKIAQWQKLKTLVNRSQLLDGSKAVTLTARTRGGL